MPGAEVILSFPWYNRVRVLQEMVLSRDPWIQCGSRRVQWSKFCSYPAGCLENSLNIGCDSVQSMNALRMLVRSNLKDVVESNHGKRIVHIEDTYSATEFLFRVLHTRRGLGVSIASDMVFAHRGLLSERKRHLI